MKTRGRVLGPSAAHAMEDIALVDFELTDSPMSSDPVNVVSGGLLTALDPEPADDTDKRSWSGPLQGEPQLPSGGDYRFNSDVPPRAYASFGEDVKAIKWEFAAVAGYYTAINAPNKPSAMGALETSGIVASSIRLNSRKSRL